MAVGVVAVRPWRRHDPTTREYNSYILRKQQAGKQAQYVSFLRAVSLKTQELACVI